MKKVFIILFFFNFLLGYSQTHMTFMDIPIDGKLETFEKVLLDKGYRKSSAVNTYHKSITKSFDGKFLDYSLCTIDVLASCVDSIVNAVSVDVSKYRSYKLNIINHFKSIYGEPKYEKVVWETFEWELDNGIICIMYDNKDTGMFRIRFVDKINNDKNKTCVSLNDQPGKISERTPNEHLMFMNVPLDGVIETFHTKMLAKGLKISDFNKQVGKGVRAYEGKFADENAIICILYDSKTQLVHSALVSFLPMDTDKSITKNVELEFSFRKKYGEERVVNSETDVDEFIAGLISQKNVYLEEGEINIKHSVDDSTDKGYITIIYKDKKNSEKIEKDKNDAIMNDI